MVYMSNVTQTNDMFHNATSFNVYISSWETSKVTRMDDMFHKATSFNVKNSSLETSKVTSMYSIFENALSLPDVSRSITRRDLMES
jgi:surface protein